MSRKFATGLIAATAPLGMMATAAVAQGEGGDGGQGDGDFGGQRSINVTLCNEANVALSLTEHVLVQGGWTCPQIFRGCRLPPDTILVESCGSWAAESRNFATGVQGHVAYVPLDDRFGWIRVEWDIPYVGQNSYATEAPKHYAIVQEGGSGNHASVTFTLELAPNEEK